ncbi:helix-turn-helix domain-containing protein [Alteriqipengyuania flavescens]|uniref:helix-turn-helix domain-containing protein n=1 Tax=Alteriqipengyuania flavescens TaxID=3053610 RepID=UPI0025B3EF09|nr:helix-turn-helix domain-containing protein [Alteriqipengyuania flavescens]WJY19242.1 helix-turn-helix domain-containing protein [Alteriqipengyuania flavescens]WJY25183.1 helix-turn-helix domain-containing protein [Alteriqipengyuania flavescens]
MKPDDNLTAAKEAAQRARLGCGVMNPFEAAAYLGLTEPTLRWYRCKGKGPRAQKDGGRWFYMREDLDAYRAELAA